MVADQQEGHDDDQKEIDHQRHHDAEDGALAGETLPAIQQRGVDQPQQEQAGAVRTRSAASMVSAVSHDGNQAVRRSSRSTE